MERHLQPQINGSNDNSRDTGSKRGSIFAAVVTTWRTKLAKRVTGVCWSGANQALWSLGSPLTTPLPAMQCPSVSSLRYPATIPG
ncbi:hypothetical protein K0M31_012726 [Melipona bicolor]|uniref:Uncharacterized protein n=1 Tax=Melipona bicolor TaxID=60889 RepID=A0AA40FJJ8_9HYME|nr:hypothetical protein K0M31_012726 [Melipona bicolor]